MTATACSPEACETCPGKVVCRCLQVTEDQVINLITSLKLRSIRELRQHGGAGDGCTCCHPELQKYLERHSLAIAD